LVLKAFAQLRAHRRPVGGVHVSFKARRQQRAHYREHRFAAVNRYGRGRRGLPPWPWLRYGFLRARQTRQQRADAQGARQYPRCCFHFVPAHSVRRQPRAVGHFCSFLNLFPLSFQSTGAMKASQETTRQAATATLANTRCICLNCGCLQSLWLDGSCHA